MTQQTTELEDLEKRLREMEERLRRSKARLSRQGIPNFDPSLIEAAGAQAQQQQQQQQQQAQNAHPRHVEEQLQKNKSRPGSSMTARPAPSAGDMPPTPGASEGEYEVVDAADLDDDEVAHPRSRRS